MWDFVTLQSIKCVSLYLGRQLVAKKINRRRPRNVHAKKHTSSSVCDLITKRMYGCLLFLSSFFLCARHRRKSFQRTLQWLHSKMCFCYHHDDRMQIIVSQIFIGWYEKKLREIRCNGGYKLFLSQMFLNSSLFETVKSTNWNLFAKK